jgi:hypothetical protein
MATTIVTKYGGDAPAASDLVRGELAVDTENGRLYTENSSGAVVEIGLNPEGNVDVTGTVTTTGSVGIGVAAPLDMLHLKGADPSIRFEDTSGDAYAKIEADSADEGSIRIQADVENSGANSIIRFDIDGAEKARLTDVGLGIGSTSPSAAKFSSTPDGVLNVSGNKPVVYLTEEDETDSNVWMGLSNEVGIIGNTGDALAFRTGSSTATERMRIDSSGNVGISQTPSGSHKLEVTQIGGDGINVNSGSDFGGIRLTDNSHSYAIRNAANKFFIYDVTNTTQRITLNDSGNVGIGTDNPLQPLTVQANSGTAAIALNGRAADGISSLSFYANDGTTSQGYLQGKSDSLRVWAASGDFLSLASDGSEAARFDTSGNLLVNDTSVSGNAEKFRITSGGTSSATAAALFNDSAGTELFFVRSDGAFRTGSGTSSPYNNTAAVTANCFINTDGTLVRATSSRRYKKDIVDARFGLSDVLNLRPVNYKGINSEVDEDTVYGGLIAEEVHDAGLTEFVEYNKENQPDSLRYQHMVSLCIKAIQEQQDLIESLTARVAQLES